jgi:hypothetical protein
VALLPPGFYMESVLLIVLVVCVVLLCVFTFREFRVVMSVTIYAYKTMFGSCLPPVVCRRAHVLFTLFMFVFTASCL